MQPAHRHRGDHAETIAAAFLALNGYHILERNFRYSRLEIDLLAEKEGVLLVVEVKYRRRTRLGGARGAVSAQKQRDLETAALGYLRVTGRTARVRFDVIVVEGTEDGLTLCHLRGAFPASGRYRA